MKIISTSYTETLQIFKGSRVARNTVEQLCKNNRYSLTETNQRNIVNAINELSKVKGNKNIKFLLNVASKNKYSTNIQLKDLPKHDWKSLLLTAAIAVASATPFISENLKKRLDSNNKTSTLSRNEKQILDLRESILKKVDKKQVETEAKGGMKNFKRNMDYFIVSSETTVEDKKYVLEKLNYMLSDKYKINPQLKDRKSIVFAEMINDLAIHTPGQKIPNIKAVNQKHHGMCAAISIVRKLLVYEDKRNYVDSLLSELDDSNYISVYDRSKLGSGKKINVDKVTVDFDAAIANGYRIIDASAMHWMQIAQMNGEGNTSLDKYKPFDRENFDVKTDTFFNVKIDSKKEADLQNYYQALIKAKRVLNDYKASKIKANIIRGQNLQTKNKKSDLQRQLILALDTKIKALSGFKTQDLFAIRTDLLALEHSYSGEIKKGNKFAYIPNEEECVKKEKIKKYLCSKLNTCTISDADAESILNIADDYNMISKNLGKSSRNSTIRRAKDLYEVGAAYRYQIIQGLKTDKCIEYYMLEQKITNKENLVLKTIEQAISMISNNHPQTNLIVNQLSKMFNSEIKSPEEMIKALTFLKGKINNMLTSELDSIYASLNLKSRKEQLKLYLEMFLDEVEKNDKNIIKDLATVFSVKNNQKNVKNALTKNINQLLNGTEDDYIRIFDLMENTSQIKVIANMYQNIMEEISNGGDDGIILNFMKTNGIEETDNPEPLVKKLEEIQNQINNINQFIKNTEQGLKVYDNDGNILLSASPQDIIIKNFEANDKIPKASVLRELQKHFEKIEKEVSSDEFEGRRGLLRNSSLAKFSNEEKSTLNLINERINPMVAYVQRELNNVQTDLKDILEELKRVIGVNNGNYWVNEGSTGLSWEQEIKILEYMTGRPYHLTKDIKKGIEKIKEGPFSGITTSSVFHDRIGSHAQYIADIEPVTILEKDSTGNIKKNTREILYQDNSWGAIEKENTWKDSSGLERTDYSDNRGGSLGYITNNKYRNGNFVDRILNEMITRSEPEQIPSKVYKKLRPNEEPYMLPQYYNIIIPGTSPKLKSFTDELHDTIFISDTKYIDQLQEQLKQSSYEEISSMITNLQYAGKDWSNTYKNLLQRIYPGIDKGIKTEEDYNNIEDNDYLKVALEKTALKKNYQIAGREAELAKIKNAEDLSNFENGQKARAINEFKYAFGKNPQLREYVADAFTQHNIEELQKIYDKYNLQLSIDEQNHIFSDFEFATDDFDGSLQNSIDLIMADIIPRIDEFVVNHDASLEVKNYFRKYFEDKLYFKISDINNRRIEHIVKFIDREYAPNDNNEFVKIYKQIQNMTSEDFKEKVIPRIKDEDLGITKFSGYDVLKDIQKYDAEAKTNFMNTIYYDFLVQELNLKDYGTKYQYSKLSRKPKYKSPEDFNTIYRNLSADLSYLTLPKLFNKYKAQGIKTYGAYPAYPKLDYITDELIGNTIQDFSDNIEKYINSANKGKDLKNHYKIARKMKLFGEKISTDAILSDYQYKRINYLAGSIVTLNYNDEDMQDYVQAAEEILELPKGSKWKDYQGFVNRITEMTKKLEDGTPENTINKFILKKKNDLHIETQDFLNKFIQKKYRARMTETINNLKHALIKGKENEANEYKNILFDEYLKYNLLQNPNNLLDEYILSCPESSPTHNYNSDYKELLYNGLKIANLAEIQDMLMNAISDGVAMNAKSIFDKYQIALTDGTTDSMNSDKIIAIMVNQLIMGNQNETALMFIDKLGLGEAYVREMSKIFDFDAMKKMIKSSADFANQYSQFINGLNTELNNVEQELEGDEQNYVQILDTFKKSIKKLAKQNSINKKQVKLLFKSIDNLKADFIKNPNQNIEAIFVGIFKSEIEMLTSCVNEQLSDTNSTMETNYVILDILNRVKLKEKSEEYKLRDYINKNFEEISEYQKGLLNLQDTENSDKI